MTRAQSPSLTPDFLLLQPTLGHQPLLTLCNEKSKQPQRESSSLLNAHC